MTIVKVQLPLASTDPVPKALIYDHRRLQSQLSPITPELTAMMGNDVKAFFEADLIDGAWRLKKRVGFQRW